MSEVTTFDAVIGNGIRVYDKATYPEAHDATSGEVGVDDYFYIESSLDSGGLYVVERGFVSFDTSSLVGKTQSAELSFTFLCFAKGTLISTPKGLLPIESITRNVFVYAKDLVTGQINPRRVVETFKSKSEVMRIITQHEVIKCSSRHPLHVIGRSWVIAGKLSVGDVLTTQSGETLITQIERQGIETEEVFDLKVDGDNNYFVSSERILVHNKTEHDVGQATIHVVEGIFGNDLATGDFGTHLSKITSGGSKSHDEFKVTPVILLNAIGLGWINKTGTTKFCLRLAGDIDNQTPTGNNYFRVYGAGSQGPKLVVTSIVVAHRHHPTVPNEPNIGRILSGMGSLKASFLYTEEQTAYDVEMWLCPTYFFRSGQYLTISNRVVSKLSFPLRKDGEPTGDVTFTIRRVFDDSILASKVWGDASALSTSTTWENVTFDTPVLINEQVRILAEFYGGDEDNHVVYHLESSDVKAGEYSTYYYDGGYYDDESQDGPYIYTYRSL